MDLGVVGLDGLVGSDTCGFGSLASDPETKHNKWYGSGLLKQERSSTTEDEWRSSKLLKTDEISPSKAMLFHQRNSLLRSNATLFSDGHHQQHMLSFSSPKPDSFLGDKAPPNATLPYSYHPLSSYSRNTGYGSGSMHGAFSGAKGPFTPSQWMELEHQALIYKYITANVPVPSHLLIPIRKALDSAAFCNFSNGLLRPNALAWGGFHLGYSNNTDPEPGRCRRTDGKKWRCSRDAVVDQKYCERHINRGRHRSRKPVEGQSGHALTNPTTTTTSTPNTSSKLNASSSVVVPHQEPSNNMHLPPHSSPPNSINRMFMSNKENNNTSERVQDGPALPMLPPTLELKPKENPFMIHKQKLPYDESSKNNNEFGLVTSDSLLNPSQKNSTTTLLSNRSFGSSQKDSESQHSLRHFIDESDMQSDRTQLSISIPISSSDFMSFTTSSPSNEKLTLSPLRLSRELDPIQMGLGVGSGLNESTTRQANWIPITWESSSMGGPLGEVLNLSSSNNSNASDHCGKNTSALNLMTDGWDSSPPLGSSPTGVLQKTAFGSLSNSSAGSSPRAENNKEGATLCNDLLPAL
ncbi:growth-regulating factor 1-like [Abrus precatorius]|uniref:Growth-regulating factor n=1 Tax=Abrus precatorius TaxID=3816 RepID=A0A8B8JLV5_ABRPR|nr:growth-regulating factor 1-like [Abrus precatorius]